MSYTRIENDMFTALNVATGEVLGQSKARHRHQEFLAFLRKVDKRLYR